ncbi:MAG TPA: NADH-quinone oxidoreductase subunit C [Phycisphaerae bacterium]|nr:NADH-quinone oxidoreductase subunit C [Phycisphaerae bacterium]
MTPEEITDILKKQFGAKIAGFKFETAHPRVEVEKSAWPEVARFLKSDPRLQLNFLRSIASLDLLEDEKFVAIYDLLSMRPPTKGGDAWTMENEFSVHVSTERSNPHIPTVAQVWPAADWHERETYDLMGITFDDHPDSVIDQDGTHPRRILCADDWVGHPLRKDYKFPMEYHGIPAVTEFDQTRPIH